MDVTIALRNVREWERQRRLINRAKKKVMKLYTITFVVRDIAIQVILCFYLGGGLRPPPPGAPFPSAGCFRVKHLVETG